MNLGTKEFILQLGGGETWYLECDSTEVSFIINTYYLYTYYFLLI